jgi:hypothetical protein
MILCVLIFKFLERRWKTGDSEQNGSKHSPNLLHPSTRLEPGKSINLEI